MSHLPAGNCPAIVWSLCRLRALRCSRCLRPIRLSNPIWASRRRCHGRADIAALDGLLKGRADFDWIIVDHYGLDHQWQTAARRWARRIAAIDDLANRRHAVDLLLDQNLTGTQQAYEALTDERCERLLGPHFALLRGEFHREPLEIRSQVRRVLVNFGGFDAAGQVHQAMLALTDFEGLEVDFVAGLDNPAWSQMQALVAHRPHWRLHRYVSDFARLMVATDVFIGAGGGTSWERAALGLPTLCISVAANQRANAELLAAMGAQIYLGAHEHVDTEQLRQAVGLMIANEDLRQSLARRSRELVDGRGAERVAAALFFQCAGNQQHACEFTPVLKGSCND